MNACPGMFFIPRGMPAMFLRGGKPAPTDLLAFGLVKF